MRIYRRWAVAPVPDNEREWKQAAHAQNYKCVSCGELISFEQREVYLERGLCSYCAQMIAKKDTRVSA